MQRRFHGTSTYDPYAGAGLATLAEEGGGKGPLTQAKMEEPPRWPPTAVATGERPRPSRQPVHEYPAQAILAALGFVGVAFMLISWAVSEPGLLLIGGIMTVGCLIPLAVWLGIEEA